MKAKQKDGALKAAIGGGGGAALGSWLALNNMSGLLNSHPVIAAAISAAFFGAGMFLLVED